ncbi:MAG: SIR2 family protein [Alphaproteobacteria bacterium]
MPKKILLLGAGFSRNWGGWLASEAFEYLLGCPEIDSSNRDLLFKYKNNGGFEGALSELQKTDSEQPSEQLINLQDAIFRMFSDMNDGFNNPSVSLDFENEGTPVFRHFSVRQFLTKFDAIFTLNQDLFFELNYFDENVSLDSGGRWSGLQIPGMKRQPEHSGEPLKHQWTPLPEEDFKIGSRGQPYFKLHGSSNWRGSENNQILVMGGNKNSSIKKFPVLQWYSNTLKQYLSETDSRLMIIGYGFNDQHINDHLIQATHNGNIKFFIIDPEGIDVIDKNRGAIVHQESELTKIIWPKIIGSSRRPLNQIFGPDRVEHAKVMRFFQDS